MLHYRNIISCIFTAAVFIISFKVPAQHHLRLHQKSLVVDTHNDILDKCFDNHFSIDHDLRGKTHSDLNRFSEAGVDVQVFSVFCDGRKKNPFIFANLQIDTLIATALRNPEKMIMVHNVRELKKAVNNKKLAAMIGVEGGHMIENDLNKLDSLFLKGTRYMTLTWNNSTPWATSAMDESKDTFMQKKGLTEFGRQVVQRMNKLGMMVDLSHVGESTFRDAIEVTDKPVIASHSCSYRLCPVFRNLKDDQIIAIAKNDGVIFLNFYSGFLDSNFNRRNAAFEARHKTERDSLSKINPESYYIMENMYKKYKSEVDSLRAPLSLLLDHIDYIVKLSGVKHVGLGSDFDGISSPPKELSDITSMPIITKGLLERGYSRKDVKKILGGNFLRVLKANEP